MPYHVVHWEMLSKDPARIAAFRVKVFDWKVENMPQISYRMVGLWKQKVA